MGQGGEDIESKKMVPGRAKFLLPTYTNSRGKAPRTALYSPLCLQSLGKGHTQNEEQNPIPTPDIPHLQELLAGCEEPGRLLR